MSDEIFDYGLVLHNFLQDLVNLREHIAEHQFFVGWEDVVEEIKKAEELADKYFDYSGMDFNEEQKLWNEFWNYIRDNIQKWWC